MDPAQRHTMIYVDTLCFHYPHTQRPVFVDFSLHVPAGEFVCILGQSGCGKTTLLHLIAGFLAPTAGRIVVNGLPVCGAGPERAMIFQEATLFPWLTVADNVGFGLRAQGMGKAAITQTVTAQLERMGLAEHAHRYPCHLSGGMRQRVALARVLMLEPPVLLMDEPFSALDIPTRERLQDDLLTLWMTQGNTIIYVTHSAEEAAYLAGRILVFAPSGAIIHQEQVCASWPRDRLGAERLAVEQRLRTVLRNAATS